MITESKSGPRGHAREAGHRRHGRRRRRRARRRAGAQDAARGDDGGLGHVLDDRRRTSGASSTQVKADPQTYKDWAGNGEWDIETTGKEDDLFSPFLRKPFKQAVAAGVIPPAFTTIAGTWGTVTGPGRPHLPQPGPSAGLRRHGRRRPDRAARSRAAIRPCMAIKALRALHARLRGREAAQLRHDPRHARHAQDRRPLRPDRRRTCASRARFEDSIGIFPEFIDGYGILVLPTTGRYFQVPYRSLVPQGASPT